MFELPIEYYRYSGLCNAIVCFLIAFFVFKKRPQFAPARLYSCFSILTGAWSLFYYLWLCETENPIVADILMRTCMVFVLLMPAVFLHFVSALTNRLTNKVIHLINYSISLLLCATVYSHLFSPGVSAHLVFPFWLIPGVTFWVHLAHITISNGIGLWVLGAAAYKSTGLIRKQLLWVFWGFIIAWTSGYTNYFVWLRLPFPPVLNPFVSLYVLIISYGIVRHQFLDIRIVIQKSVIYSLLIASITATYLVAVLVIERLFQGVFGYESVVATVIVAFLISIFFNPVRNRIQTLVDRSLFKATTVELAEQHEKLLLQVRKSEQQKAVATLAAGMAHEIKNPLTAIKTFTEHLPERFDSEEFRNKFNRIVGGEVERINNIVQQLLDFSKPVPPKLQPVQIHNLLDETLDFLNNDFIKHRIEVSKNYDGVSTIQGDPQQLKQVFLNLFLNSLQAMNGNGKLIVTTGQSDSDLSITIQDNGSGMSQEVLDHLFEPFYTTKASGTGLGLSVVKGIIGEHGGEICVASNKGKGTTVNIEIPIACEALDVGN